MLIRRHKQKQVKEVVETKETPVKKATKKKSDKKSGEE